MAEISYRDILRAELAARSAQNPRYSLRAFSRFIAVEPGQLCCVLSGKKNISLLTARAVAQKLFNSARDREYFESLVELETARRPQARDLAFKRLRSLKPVANAMRLQVDTMTTIADWYHFAILDLTSIRTFELTPSAAATYLGISELNASLAIERLIRLGLLEKVDGKLKKVNRRVTTTNNVASAGLRTYHKQIISKAIESIEAQGVERRYIIGKNIAIARRDLEKIRALADDFFAAVTEVVLESKNPDCLYQLNVQLFDLKKGKRK